jgi:phenylpropionate dioxygenase-like ring-hydroxylating dioxygenase large terminal subunit
MYGYRMTRTWGPLPVGHPLRLDNAHPALAHAWHPVCRAVDLENSAGVVGVRLLGEAWAVGRIDGELFAFVDRCPHRMAPLSAGCVVDGALQCGYHGYRFAADGTCTAIPAIGANGHVPAKANATAAAGVAERYGLIWIAIEQPTSTLIDVPEWDDPSFTIVALPPLDWNAGAAQMTDNFLDLAHFPYVHPTTFGDPDATSVPEYQLDRDGYTFTTVHQHSTRSISNPGTADAPNTNDRRDTFVYGAPFTIRLRIEYLADDVVLTILFFHQPVDAQTTRLYCYDLRNDIADGRTTVEEARNFQLAVAAEDKALLERLPDKSISLDPQREVHTKADRITLEMRRIMADFVYANRNDAS